MLAPVPVNLKSLFSRPSHAGQIPWMRSMICARVLRYANMLFTHCIQSDIKCTILKKRNMGTRTLSEVEKKQSGNGIYFGRGDVDLVEQSLEQSSRALMLQQVLKEYT